MLVHLPFNLEAIISNPAPSLRIALRRNPYVPTADRKFRFLWSQLDRRQLDDDLEARCCESFSQAATCWWSVIDIHERGFGYDRLAQELPFLLSLIVPFWVVLDTILSCLIPIYLDASNFLWVGRCPIRRIFVAKYCQYETQGNKYPGTGRSRTLGYLGD